MQATTNQIANSLIVPMRESFASVTRTDEFGPRRGELDCSLYLSLCHVARREDEWGRMGKDGMLDRGKEGGKEGGREGGRRATSLNTLQLTHINM